MKTNIKILKLIAFLLLINIQAIAGEPPRKPFVILTINGKTYNPESEIIVRPGEKILIQAIMMGGRRDYCMFPEKYANVGKNVVIESKGETGMSFNINGGQFRGVWTLTKETAKIQSDNAVKIEMKDELMNRQVEAYIQAPTSGFSNIYFKVKVDTKWHYVRTTPAGKKEEDDTNSGESTFYLKIAGDVGAWYNSANISANGEECVSVRNDLDAVQRFYNETAQWLQKKDFAGAQQQFENLKNAIATVKSSIETEKQKNPQYKCEITFIGLPSDLVMEHITKIQTLADKWKEMYLITQGNVSKINEMLLNVQNGFSANVLRSVFKNYINWGTSIPTGAYDLLTIYDPNNVLAPLDMPRKVMDWWTEANDDATILNQQVQTIKILSQLRKFYMERMTKCVSENKEFHKILNDLKPAKEIHTSLTSYFSGISWAKWRRK